MSQLKRIVKSILNGVVIPVLFGAMFYYILNLRSENTSLQIRLDNSQRQADQFLTEKKECEDRLWKK